MGNYEIVSFDMFQTLVDVNKRIAEIWHGILGDGYTEEKALIGSNAVLKSIPVAYNYALNKDRFMTMEEVYDLCADEVLRLTKFHVSRESIAYNLMLQHSFAPFYSEVLECLHKIKKYFRVIICSDSNHLMVDNILNKIEYDEAFISDDLRHYKGDKKGGFFQAVLSKTAVPPERIIHIGDSPADISGAANAGIAGCLITRIHTDRMSHNREELKNTVQPAFLINDMTELYDILKI